LNLSNHFVQYKYNGHRCLITNDGEQNIAYSRNGKEIKTINHILDGLNLDKGQTLDGELYIHGKKLQNIGSLVKKIQPDNKYLNYIVYDTITPDPYEKRLDRLIKAQFNAGITVAPTRYGDTIKSMAEELTRAILDGYEGLMLRANDTGYQAGKRSKSLIKVKQALDSEFIVIDVIPSVDGWGILECLVDIRSEKTFRVSAPGTIQDKTNILINKYKYIGSFVNVEFFEWTNDGKPFHPVAMFFREEE
jgi:ATP-dependent DNA ligase